MASFDIIRLDKSWRSWARNTLRENWGSEQIVTRGRMHQADMLPGFLALSGDLPKGLITYRVEEGECEIVTLNSLEENRGIGTGLTESVKKEALSLGCKRIWLITTNDNMKALAFYQKRGLRLKAVYPDAIKTSRLLKPNIPLVGGYGIPLRDEIELEMFI